MNFLDDEMTIKEFTEKVNRERPPRGGPCLISNCNQPCCTYGNLRAFAKLVRERAEILKQQDEPYPFSNRRISAELVRDAFTEICRELGIEEEPKL
jgi:hypothetical protein